MARGSQRQNSDVLELETGDGPAVDGAACEVERSDGGPWILPVSDLGPFLSSLGGCTRSRLSALPSDRFSGARFCRSGQTDPGWLVLPGTRSCHYMRPGTTNTDQATIGPMIAISAL